MPVKQAIQSVFATCIAALHNYISGEVCVKACASLGCRGKNQAQTPTRSVILPHYSPLLSSSPPPPFFSKLQANPLPSPWKTCVHTLQRAN